MGNWVRIIKKSQTIKMALKRPIRGSTDPAAKRFGQVQEAFEHKGECIAVPPNLSLEIRKLTMSLAVHESTVRGGDKAPKNWEGCCSSGGFCLR